MRRSDREITDNAALSEILSECKVCRVAFSDGEFPYIVPLNYGFTLSENTLTLYFHSAREGKKLDLLRANGNVCFELDCAHRLTEGEIACDYGFNYKSIIGTGKAELITDGEEKLSALKSIMLVQTGRGGFTFSENMVNAVAVWKITSTAFSGKQRQA